MGQNETRPMAQSGIYQQEQPRQTQADEVARRIKRKLEQGKVKPQQPRLSIQSYNRSIPPQAQSQHQSHIQPQTDFKYNQQPLIQSHQHQGQLPQNIQYPQMNITQYAPQTPTQYQPQYQQHIQQQQLQPQFQPYSSLQMSLQNKKSIQIQRQRENGVQECQRRNQVTPKHQQQSHHHFQRQQIQRPLSPSPQMIQQHQIQHPAHLQTQPHFVPQQQPQPQQRVQPQPHPNHPKPQLDHQNIIKLSPHPFHNCIQTDKGFLEHCQLSVAQLIQSRYNTKMHFPQENVIALFESIIYAMAALEAKQIRHHDIYPTNIFFHNGIFKLSNPNLTPLSSYHLTLNRKRFSFLSPQLIICLRQQIEPIKQDLLFRSDMFSFGLVMLEFCSLKPSQQCYDQQNYDIIDVVIKRRLAEIKQIYNPRISEGIEILLRYEVEKRMGAMEFARYLNQAVHQHRAEIASKTSQIKIQQQQLQQQQFQQQASRDNSRVNIVPLNNSAGTQHQQQRQFQQQQVLPQHQIPPEQNRLSYSASQNRQFYQPSVQHSSQTNSRVNITQTYNPPQQQPRPQQLFNTLPTPQQQLLSHAYIRSPISPSTQFSSPTPQVQRTYISSPPPQYLLTQQKQQFSHYAANDFNLNQQEQQQSPPIFNQYTTMNTPSQTSSKYEIQTYTFQSKNYAPYITPSSSIPHSPTSPQTNNFMKPEKDPSFSILPPSSNQSYKRQNRNLSPNRVTQPTEYQYQTTTTTAIINIGGRNSSDKPWTDIKYESRDKYGYGSQKEDKYGLPGVLTSPKYQAEGESLEERVRRILEKSKNYK